MNILKEHLETLWYEDKNGERVKSEDYMTPEGAQYQISRFPNELSTHYLKLNDDGTSAQIMTMNNSWNEEVVLAMANSGDFTLKESILIYASACERCINALWNKYCNGVDGYEEYSEEWQKCNTECQFCK